MTSRQRSIVLLLSSIEDYLPALGSSLNPTTGMAAIERRPCSECGHTSTRGWVSDAFKRRRPCRSCGGTAEPTGAHSQWVAKDRGRGWVYVDPMDVLERPVQTSTEAAPSTKPGRMMGCDGCGGWGDKNPGTGVSRLHLDDDGNEIGERCDHCDGSGWREVTRFDLRLDTPQASADICSACDGTGLQGKSVCDGCGGDGGLAEGIDRAISKRNEAGSYRELETALAAETAYGQRLILSVYGPSPARDIDTLWAAERLAVRLVLAHLDRAMPDRILVPGAVRQAAKEREKWLRKVKSHTVKGGQAASPQALAVRDKEVRKLVRQGKPVQWVAREHGLTPRRVYQIINGEQEAA